MMAWKTLYADYDTLLYMHIEINIEIRKWTHCRLLKTRGLVISH